MAVLILSKQKDGGTNLSKNFKAREFACQDGSDKILVSEEMVALLQKIRDHFETPVTVNSGYRTTSHNKAVGGSPVSQHLLGMAADISVEDVAPLKVVQYAEYLLGGSGGIGLYGTFSHIDVRAARSRWDQRSGVQVAVSGFPGFQVPQTQEPEPADAVPVRALCLCGATLAEMDGLRVNGQVYAPVRALCEALGHQVDWDGVGVTVGEKTAQTHQEAT